jgi:hypothetical protein
MKLMLIEVTEVDEEDHHVLYWIWVEVNYTEEVHVQKMVEHQGHCMDYMFGVVVDSLLMGLSLL